MNLCRRSSARVLCHYPMAHGGGNTWLRNAASLSIKGWYVDLSAGRAHTTLLLIGGRGVYVIGYEYASVSDKAPPEYSS